MLKFGRNELICDMAETYNVYDMGSLPAETVAILACGLRDNSRIKIKISGNNASLETLLMAQAVDRLGLLVWSKTKDGARNKNRPASIVEELLNKPNENKKHISVTAFESPDDFENARKSILGRTAKE